MEFYDNNVYSSRKFIKKRKTNDENSITIFKYSEGRNKNYNEKKIINEHSIRLYVIKCMKKKLINIRSIIS